MQKHGKIKGFTLFLTVAVTFVWVSLIPHQKINAVTLSVPGIISEWTFDETSGTVAADSVGNNNGTLIGGVSHVAGQFDNALNFDGIDDYVDVPPSSDLDITGDVTVTLWVKRSTFGSKSQALFKKGGAADAGIDTPASYTMHFLPDPDNRVVAGFERADGSNAFIEGTPVSDTDFHMYTYVREGSSHRLYVDGVLVADSPFTGSPGSTPNLPLLIGAQRVNTSDASEYLGGVIDELQIYNRAISDLEIQKILNHQGNEVPLAVAGTSLDQNNLLELNGSLSSDLDGVIMSYSWQIDGEANPRNGQIVSISDLPTGEYSVELKVTDDKGTVGTDNMLLGVPFGAGAPPGEDVLQEKVQEIKDFVTSLSVEALVGANNQSKDSKRMALLNILDSVSNLISGEDYQTAIAELRDLAEKTDGIAPPESSPDWVIDDLSTANNEPSDFEQLINDLINNLSSF